jgi:3-hydroxyacyl-CoA dehydrogenase/enoyl-CoA hydratase/3-hydroxybutyryl-CoA epimerase
VAFRAQTATKKDTGVDGGCELRRPNPQSWDYRAGLMGSGIATFTAGRARLLFASATRMTKACFEAWRRAKDVDKLKKRPTHQSRRCRRLYGPAYLQPPTTAALVRLRGHHRGPVFEDLKPQQKVVQEVEELGPRQRDLCFEHTPHYRSARLRKQANTRKRSSHALLPFAQCRRCSLLEIIVTEKTSAEVTADCVALGKAQGKDVICRSLTGVGFTPTHPLAPILERSLYLLTVKPYSIETIDRAWSSSVSTVGPIKLTTK